MDPPGLESIMTRIRRLQMDSSTSHKSELNSLLGNVDGLLKAAEAKKTERNLIIKVTIAPSQWIIRPSSDGLAHDPHRLL